MRLRACAQQTLSLLQRAFVVLSMFATIVVAANLSAGEANAASTSTGCLPGSVKSKLAQIRKKFGPVRVISTHRPGARIAGSGKRSYHASCRAADFHPPKGKYRQVVAWLKKNHAGGVGTYSCGMHHIHIDNGPRVRFHKCVGAKKRKYRKSRYAKRSKRKTYSGRSAKRRYTKRSKAKRAGVRRKASRAKPRQRTAARGQRRWY